MRPERPEVAPRLRPFVVKPATPNLEPVPVATSAEGCASGECLPEVDPNTTSSTAASTTAGAVSPLPPVVHPPPKGQAVALSPPPNAIPPPLPSAPEPASLENEVPAEGAVVTNHDRFKRAVEALRQENPRLGKSFSHARFVTVDGATLKVAFPADAGFHRATVFGSGRDAIEALLSKIFGRTTKLHEDTSTAALQEAPKSIAENEASARAAREQRIEAAVRTHPSVVNVMKILGGQLELVHVLEPESPRGSAEEAERDEPVDAPEPD